MAYNSSHSGAEIDAAVEASKQFFEGKDTSEGNTLTGINNDIETAQGMAAAWTPYRDSINWTSLSSGDTKYQGVITVANVDSIKSSPMVWIEDNSNNHYYCDYTYSYSGTSCEIIVYSNTNMSNSKICVLGLYRTSLS